MTKRESERSDPSPDSASSAGRLLRALGISAASTSSCRRPGPDAGPALESNDHRDDDIELDDFACRRRHREAKPAHEEYTENQTRSSIGSAFTRPPHRRSSSVTSLESAASTSSTSSTSSLWSLFAPFSRDSRDADTARQKAPREVRRQDAAHQVWRDYW